MRLSRRQFLSEIVDSSACWLKSALKAVGDDGGLSSDSTRAEWVVVGTLAQFPVGSERLVNNGKQILASDERGLRARDVGSPGIPRALRLGERGQLLMNPCETWPPGNLLSPMTGVVSDSEEREV